MDFQNFELECFQSQFERTVEINLADSSVQCANVSDLLAGEDAGEEMGAIAWSYAAALHIGLDPRVVFHEDGYKGAANSHSETPRSQLAPRMSKTRYIQEISGPFLIKGINVCASYSNHF